MTERDALTTSRKLFAAWNAHDADAWLADLAPDFVYQSDSLPQPIVRGHDGARTIFTTYVTAFPDLRFDIEQEIVSGPWVVVRWQAAGTHDGPLNDIPATHRHVVTKGCTVGEFANGKQVRSWTYWDNVSLLRQLGVMPAHT